MRWLVIVGVMSLGCADDEPKRSRLSCDPPASSYGGNCACFDGDVRCDPYPTCPVDLTVPCMPTDKCGDLSGGSDGQDCQCTCTDAKTWSCMGYDGACIPM
jgi:hypothetical protein